MRLLKFLLLLLPLSPLGFAADPSARDTLELKPGDHIVLIGNALADRFQHSGWLETYIYARYPKLDLVFRNLAVAGDEIVTRHRPENFGSPEEWLTKTQPDIIFAFFGFNESFRGPEGLERFKSDLENFLKGLAAKNYSGKGAPRVVLFSPIANERHQDTNLPDPKVNNNNLREYTEAMREVAKANGVTFVDLFEPSQRLFAQAARRGQSLTVNGVHLTEEGDKEISEAIFQGLFGETAPFSRAGESPAPVVPGETPAPLFLDKLRRAVNEKNAQWHARYRTVDGNNVYGGRSALAYQPGKGGFITDRNASPPHISNFKVMQEEMSQRDVMTANRDKRVWAVAKGGELTVDDSNVPQVTPIKSNLPGPNADESFQFLGGEQAIGKMKVHSGMKVNLFASEEQFPELAKPVQMLWDLKGRLWVAVWPNYPERTPESKIGDSLLVLEDTNGDGKADKCTHFIDDLNAPTGFQFYKDGVLLMQAPDFWFVRDNNGDGRADWRERVLMGLCSADSHHTANSICLDPGGAAYLSDGVFHRTQVETASGPVRNRDAAIYRFEPRTGKFETYVAYDFANPHGRVFDYWGNDLITDGTGNNTYFAPAFSGRLDYPAKHRKMEEFWDRPSRPCAATTILTSRHFPEEFQGNFLNCNVIGFQGIYRVKITEEGSGLKGERLEDLISSSDPSFRPVAVNIGPDGAIYFADWQNPIIGHMQHHLRDPNRDHAHGRIYRISYTGRPLLKAPRIEGRSISALLELLKEPENQIRELAKIELGKRSSSDVIPAVRKWASKLSARDAAYQHHLTEALWVCQWHNVVETNLLQQMLRSSDSHARAAAARVLCYWRDRIPGALGWFKTLADDESPRVRLEAVRAASFFNGGEAVETALTVLKHATDYYLDYTLRETLRQLEPWWRKALSAGQPIATDNPNGSRFLLQTIRTPELLKLPRSSMVCEAILTRADALDADRMVALGELAQARKTDLVSALLAELDAAITGQSHWLAPMESNRESGRVARRARANTNSHDAVKLLASLLPYQVPDKLKPARAQLVNFARKGSVSELRQYAWAALVLADGSFDNVWDEAAKSTANLTDLLNGVPALPDSELRAQAYERVKPLLQSSSNATTSESSAVRPAAIRALVSMNRDPEPIFSSLTDLIAKGEEVNAATQGLRAIPRAKWPRSEAARAATALADWTKKIPSEERTSDLNQLVQLASDLATLLPPDQAASLRKELPRNISGFVIRTVREQMRYDTPRLVVEPQQALEIVFENADFMPHNLVIIKPNTREKLGVAAAAMKPEDLDREGRAYIPDSPDILAASKMLLPGQRELLKLKAPATEGEYEYFCTFPGHYQVMWGRLIVTKSVDEYLRDHPEPVLPSATTESALEKGSAHSHEH